MAVARIIVGDALEQLRRMPAESVHCCVTSPPYYGLRDYGVAPTAWGGEEDCAHAWGAQGRGAGGRFCGRCGAWLGQLGLEPTVGLYVEHLVSVLEEVRRVLRHDGTLWLNLGDSYSHGGCGARDADRWPKQSRNDHAPKHAKKDSGIKPKDLVGAPWRVALALLEAGWWLRSDIVVSKRAPMPESVEDRPTRAHEYVFLFAKSQSYFYDRHAVSEPAARAGEVLDYTGDQKANSADPARQRTLPRGRKIVVPERRNMRDVLEIGPEPFREAHFAVMPTALAEPCVMAGTSERGCCAACGAPWARVVEKSYDNPGNRTTNGPRSLERRHETAGFAVRLEQRTTTTGWEPTCDCGWNAVRRAVVLDPFAGAGTTGLVALRLRRDFVGVEAKAEYAEMARRRLERDAPMFDSVTVEEAPHGAHEQPPEHP